MMTSAAPMLMYMLSSLSRVRRVNTRPRRLPIGMAALAACLAVCAWGSPGTAAAQGCPNADALPGQISTDETEVTVTCLLNEERAPRGLRPLKPNGALAEAADAHTAYMLEHDCFLHQCPGEKNLIGRIQATPYLPCRCRWGVGENLAYGTLVLATPRALVDAWMDSPGHRANVLNRKFRHVGLGVRDGTPNAVDVPVSTTYTADFGYRKRLKRR